MKTTVCILVFFFTAGFAEEYLISVHHLPVQHRNSLHVINRLYDNFLIIARDENISHLEKSGIEYTLLDSNPRQKSGNYYIVYPFAENEAAIRAVSNIIGTYRDFYVVLVKPEQRNAFFALRVERELLTFDRYVFKDPRFAGTTAFRSRYRDEIAEAVARVSVDSLRSTVRVLQRFKTRHSTKNAGDVAPWIANKYKQYGCDSVYLMKIDGFGPNVIGVMNGTKAVPGSYCLFCAHFDAVLADDTIAAGADDNASGTAALLEAARIASGYRFENTIRFVSFNAEEQGLVGSKTYVDTVKKYKESIIGGVINFDMIGYAKDSPCLYIHIDSTRPGCREFGNYFKTTASNYVSFDIRTVMNSDVVHCSDHEAFLRFGCTAIMGSESPNRKNICPNYHRPGDLLDDPGGLNNSELMANSTRAAVAVLADCAKPVGTVALHSGNRAPVCEFTISEKRAGAGVTIRFSIAERKTPVTVGIYTAQGKRLTIITEKAYPEGTHTIFYPLATLMTGLYIVDCRSGAIHHTKQIAHVR